MGYRKCILSLHINITAQRRGHSMVTGGAQWQLCATKGPSGLVPPPGPVGTGVVVTL